MMYCSWLGMRPRIISKNHPWFMARQYNSFNCRLRPLHSQILAPSLTTSVDMSHKDIDWEGYAIVDNFMMWGPFGQVNPNSTCMVDNICIEKFPIESTIISQWWCASSMLTHLEQHFATSQRGKQHNMPSTSKAPILSLIQHKIKKGCIVHG